MKNETLVTAVNACRTEMTECTQSIEKNMKLYSDLSEQTMREELTKFVIDSVKANIEYMNRQINAIDELMAELEGNQNETK